MSDATYIELPATQKRRSFFKSWRGAALCLFILAVIAAGWFSWWLSEGKISSSYARVDTIVYTVEPQVDARVDEIMVYQGEQVQSGQPLARIDANNPAREVVPPPPVQENPVQTRRETERRMTAQAAQARNEEEMYQKMHQDRVTEHVRAQLVRRSLDHDNYGAWEQASRVEEAARARMENSREQFEKVSQRRATMDAKLGQMRYESARKGLLGGKDDTAPKPAPQPAPEVADTALYAPVNGKIMEISAYPGQIVQRGQPVFMILPTADGKDTDKWIQAWFPLSAQKMLKTGQKASIKSGAMHLTGRVSAIAAEAQYMPLENGRRREYEQYIPVRIQVDDPDELARLEPGASVDCQIQTRYVIGTDMF